MLQIILLAIVSTFGAQVAGQYLRSPDHYGTEFMVAFGPNGVGTDSLVFLSKEDCTVNVEVPGVERTSVSLKKNQVHRLNYDSVKTRMSQTSGVEKKGIYINASNDISVVGINSMSSSDSVETFLALPIDIWNPPPTYTTPVRYVVTAYHPSPGSQSFVMVASPRDLNSVVIKFRFQPPQMTVNLRGVTYRNGDSVTVQLTNKEVLQILAANADLTGTEITAQDAVSVFSGAVSAQIPIGVDNSEHVIEQMYPVSSWGNVFALTSMLGRTGSDVYRVTASADDTKIFINDDIKFEYLNKGDYLERSLSSSSAGVVISADKPVCVHQYSTGFFQDYQGGDPSMTLIPPMEQKAPFFSFITPNIPGTNHYLTIAVLPHETTRVFLDAVPVTGWKIIMHPGKVHSVAKLSIPEGIHNLILDGISSGVTAILYGFRTGQPTIGYSHPIGFRLNSFTYCVPTTGDFGDGIDNDCDGRIDEEVQDCVDNDGDKMIDEDLSAPGACLLTSEGTRTHGTLVVLTLAVTTFMVFVL